MNELYLRLALDDIHRKLDQRTNGAIPSAAQDADNHLSRMRRLINWTGTTLGANTSPARDRVAPLPAVAPAPA